MSVPPHLNGQARRPVLPRRTVRMRLSALYGTLFLASGAGLLTITNILAHGWPWPTSLMFPSATVLPASSTSPSWISVTHVSRITLNKLAAQFATQSLNRLDAEHTAALRQLLVESAIALGVMAVVSAVLGWMLAGRILRPLQSMTAATRAISADDLSQRLAMPGPDDELKDLGDTIDGLLRRLETAFSAQRRFAANASHELRTPLAMMRTSLDVATAKPHRSPDLLVLAGKLREGLDRADRLVENLLLLARAQYGAMDDQETAPLDPLIAAAVAARAGLIASMDLDVRYVGGGPGAVVTGNPVLLAQLTGNLIDNAVRHNYPGGWIRAQIAVDGPAIRLLVENSGLVLDPGKITTLTQPFRRLGGDRIGTAGGIGLGLSIAEAIATAHGGSLRLQGRPEGGLRAVIDLPAGPPTSTSTRPPVHLAMDGAAR